jgi:hypothetical protein
MRRSHARNSFARATVCRSESSGERLPFKANVRKLKRLGLTISLETGYRLSPRGEAYLTAVESEGTGA